MGVGVGGLALGDGWLGRDVGGGVARGRDHAVGAGGQVPRGAGAGRGSVGVGIGVVVGSHQLGEDGLGGDGVGELFPADDLAAALVELQAPDVLVGERAGDGAAGSDDPQADLALGEVLNDLVDRHMQLLEGVGQHVQGLLARVVVLGRGAQRLGIDLTPAAAVAQLPDGGGVEAIEGVDDGQGRLALAGHAMVLGGLLAVGGRLVPEEGGERHGCRGLAARWESVGRSRVWRRGKQAMRESWRASVGEVVRPQVWFGSSSGWRTRAGRLGRGQAGQGTLRSSFSCFLWSRAIAWARAGRRY